MSESYTYPLTAYLDDKVEPPKLKLEIEQSSITKVLELIVVRDAESTITFDAPLDTGEQTTLDTIVANHDGLPIVYTPTEFEYWQADPLVTDPRTGKQYRASVMLALECQREILNPVDSPLYVPGFDALNPIHQKLGWHNQEVFAAGWTRPKDLLVYYGWPSAFNALGSNEAVAQAMARYGIVVLGAGLEEPTHGDYANTVAIVARVKALNPSAIIFGYIDGAIAQATFETKVGQWNTVGVDGIFADKFGYDFGNTRAQQNDKTDYVHAQSMLMFVNAWNTDHVLGTANDPSYPNATFNPGDVEATLSVTDWIMLESLAVNTTAYSGNGGYASKWDWSARIVKMIGLRATYGVNFASAGIINNGNAAGADLFKFSQVAALMASLEANGTSDTGYGAGSAAVDWWTRAFITYSSLGRVWSLNPSVQLDAADADVYHRYVESGKLSLDFSAGAQASTIVTY
jgi:hypothetical protein